MSTLGPRKLEQAEYDRYWNDELDGYSAASNGYTPHFLKFMGHWLRPLQASGKKIDALEIGCGDGFFSRELAERGCRITGIDLSPVGVEKARRRVPDGNFVVHDLTNPLPFENGKFDLVWCSEVLEHLFSPLSVLEEVFRVLRPQGLLLATVPYHGLMKNIGIAVFAFDRHYDPTYPHIRFFTKNTLAKVVRQSGLQVQTVTTCGSSLGVRDLFVPTNILLAARKDH